LLKFGTTYNQGQEFSFKFLIEIIFLSKMKILSLFSVMLFQSCMMLFYQNVFFIQQNVMVITVVKHQIVISCLMHYILSHIKALC